MNSCIYIHTHTHAYIQGRKCCLRCHRYMFKLFLSQSAPYIQATSIYVYVCVCMYVYMYVCINSCTYIHTYRDASAAGGATDACSSSFRRSQPLIYKLAYTPEGRSLLSRALRTCNPIQTAGLCIFYACVHPCIYV